MGFIHTCDKCGKMADEPGRTGQRPRDWMTVIVGRDPESAFDRHVSHHMLLCAECVAPVVALLGPSLQERRAALRPQEAE